MSLIDWLIFTIPLLFVFYFAFHSRKYIRGVADFLSAGRVCNRYVIAVADVATGLAVVTLVAQVEMNYKSGLALDYWNKLLMAPVYIICALTGYCLYRFRETRAMSLGQFLEMRYSRGMRIFGSTLRTFSEVITNMIVPAVSARFFIYLLGLPITVSIFGYEVSTFGLIIACVIVMAIFIIWCGGTVALIITDSLQSIMSYPIFAVLVIFIICNFSWFDQVTPTLSCHVAGESFINPCDIESLRDFNLFAVIVTIMSFLLNRASWIGAGATTAAKTPHEQKMASILATWRNGFAFVLYFVIGVMVITVTSHVDFADKAHAIRTDLVNTAAAECIHSPELRRELNGRVENVRPKMVGGEENVILSQRDNPDTPYLDAALDVLQREEKGNAVFQEFRTLYYQLMLPSAIRKVLPAGLIGLFALLMMMLMLSTDDTRIFSSALTIVQDIVLPVYGRRVPVKTHLLLLRIVSVLVGVVFFFGSFFMAQLDYINLFCVITTSIWLGGAGPVMIGGLYTRFGNKYGAYASLFSGMIISGGGVLVQRNWPDYIYPWLARHGWAEPFGRFLESVSKPFHPIVVWKMDPIKFPVNSNEIFFIAMVSGILLYVLVSLATWRGFFNLDKMLHRGVYGDGEKKEKKPFSWGGLLMKFVGIDENYTRSDRIIAWSVFGYSFVMTFLFAYVGSAIWNNISEWPVRYWGVFLFVVNLLIPCIVAVISTVWFTIGGVIGLRRMMRDLLLRKEDASDDGYVDADDADRYEKEEKKG